MYRRFKINNTWILATIFLLGQSSYLKSQIANNYPHDSLIHTDPKVIFTEMFEEDAIPTMMTNWNQKTNIISNIVFDSSVPSESLGTHSLKLITLDDGTNQNENTFIYKKISPDITDSVFVRYYIKYDTNTIYHHSGVYMGGKNPPSSTAGLVAGVLPLGNKEFHVGTEIRGLANGQPSSNSLFGFYNYWMGMHPFTTGPNAGFYYGNEFFNNTTDDNIDLNSWNCIEMMIKLNNPVTVSNGELKLWINGIKITHLGYQFPNGTWNETHFIEGSGIPFEGFQWRNNEVLNLNYLWLKNFNDNNMANHQGTIYFDHLVVAKTYIGPIYVPIATGTDKIITSKHITLYPNPTKDIINFSEPIKQLSVFNTLGQMVLKEANINAISSAELSNGIYIIKADDGFHKIIVNH